MKGWSHGIPNRAAANAGEYARYPLFRKVHRLDVLHLDRRTLQDYAAPCPLAFPAWPGLGPDTCHAAKVAQQEQGGSSTRFLNRITSCACLNRAERIRDQAGHCSEFQTSPRAEWWLQGLPTGSSVLQSLPREGRYAGSCAIRNS